LTLKKSK
jgi:hypothetical protein